MQLLRLSTILSVVAGVVFASETVQDAALIARTLIQTSSVATLSTAYPDDHPLAGQTFALMEYYAPCHSNGSLAILFFSISQNGRNILASSNHSATMSIQTQGPAYSLAMKPRVALVGNMTIFEADYSEGVELKACYAKSHPDAWWVPGNKAGVHDSVWARFDPHTVYFVGGFGGAHYIGHIPLDIYQAAQPKPVGPPMRIQRE